MPSKNLTKKLHKLANDDFQNRYPIHAAPKRGITDDIRTFDDKGKVLVRFSFKDTQPVIAESWTRTYLQNEIGPRVANAAEYRTYQSGDYLNDWVTVDVYFS